MSDIKYAKAGGSPVNWMDLQILDENGQPVENVLECDTEKGWARVYTGGTVGDEWETARVRGTFTIREPDPS